MCAYADIAKFPVLEHIQIAIVKIKIPAKKIALAQVSMFLDHWVSPLTCEE